MSAEGKQRRQITHPHGGHDFDPSFSPSGRRLVFRTSRGHYAPDPGGSGAEGIFVVDIRTGREHEIEGTLGGLFPAWSPVGGRILFTSLDRNNQESLRIVRPNGSLIRDLRLPTRAVEDAVWSPDGKRIAYAGHDGDGNWALWVVNADGTGAKQLTFPTPVEPAGTGGDYACAWSPDGSTILYSSGQFAGRELYAIAADGSGPPRRITRWRGADGSVGWLPNGQIIDSHYDATGTTPKWFLLQASGPAIHALPGLKGISDPIDWLYQRKQ
jgi:Tol biopolymer transport system component